MKQGPIITKEKSVKEAREKAEDAFDAEEAAFLAAVKQAEDLIVKLDGPTMCVF